MLRSNACCAEKHWAEQGRPSRAWKHCLEGGAAGPLTFRQAMLWSPAPSDFAQALQHVRDHAMATVTWGRLLTCLTAGCVCTGESVEAQGLGGHGQDALQAGGSEGAAGSGQVPGPRRRRGSSSASPHPVPRHAGDPRADSGSCVRIPQEARHHSSATYVIGSKWGSTCARSDRQQSSC